MTEPRVVVAVDPDVKEDFMAIYVDGKLATDEWGMDEVAEGIVSAMTMLGISAERRVLWGKGIAYEHHEEPTEYDTVWPTLLADCQLPSDHTDPEPLELRGFPEDPR
jgi:hypothetical protein